MKRSRKLLGITLASALLVGGVLTSVATADHVKPTTTSLAVAPASPSEEGQNKSFSGTITNTHDNEAITVGTVAVKRYGSAQDCADDDNAQATVVAAAAVTGGGGGSGFGTYGPVGADDPAAGTYYYRAFYSGAPNGGHPIASSSGCVVHVVDEANGGIDCDENPELCDEVLDCPAAPAWAAHILKVNENPPPKGSPKKVAGQDNYVSQTAHEMGPGTDFDGNLKDDPVEEVDDDRWLNTEYGEAVFGYLSGLANGPSLDLSWEDTLAAIVAGSDFACDVNLVAPPE